MLKKLLAFVYLTLSFSANAAPVTWTLIDVAFQGSGTATGSFTYDADLNLYTDVDVVTTFEPFPIEPHTYNGLLSDPYDENFPTVSATGVTFGTDPTSLYLRLVFDSSLAVPGEMVAILPTSAEDSYYGFNRYIAQGYVSASVVPLPAAAWLFGSAMLGLIGVARRKKT